MEYENKKSELNLLGLDLIEKFAVDELSLNLFCSAVENHSLINDILELKSAFPKVFGDYLGKCVKTQVTLFTKPYCKPVFRPK